MKPFSLSALLLPAALFLFSCSSPSTKLCERSVEVRMDPSCGYAYELVISLEYPVRGASQEVLAAVRAGIVSSAFGPGFLSGVEDDADEILTAAAFCEAVDAYVDQRSRDYRLDNAPLWEEVRETPEKQDALACQEMISGYFDGKDGEGWRYVLYTEDSLGGSPAGHRTMLLHIDPSTGEILVDEDAEG